MSADRHAARQNTDHGLGPHHPAAQRRVPFHYWAEDDFEEDGDVQERGPSDLSGARANAREVLGADLMQHGPVQPFSEVGGGHPLPSPTMLRRVGFGHFIFVSVHARGSAGAHARDKASTCSST